MTAVEYINSYSWLGSRLGLERINELMRRLGNPQDKLKCIHLAGTNGKGSTSCFIASILQAAGYKTGLYTSPFIHTMHEQIQINGAAITDEELTRMVERVRQSADAMDDHPTTFELITAVAFCWFFENNCEIVVLETGMGGKLDSTNIIKSPLISVITPIGMDHTEYLGETLADIAKAKAGIIEYKCPVVSSCQHPESMAVLESTADKQKTIVTKVDITKLVPGSFSIFEGQNFSFGKYDDLFIRLLGRYQMENAALAVTAVERLIDFDVPETAIRKGLASARWPGRFEVASKNPIVIADGGHNAQGAKALADNLTRYFPNQKIVFIMGILVDKDIEAIVSSVLPLAKQFFTITPNSPRALAAADLAKYINGKSVHASEADNVYAAVKSAKEAAGQDGVVCYFGSLYGMGEVLNAV